MIRMPVNLHFAQWGETLTYESVSRINDTIVTTPGTGKFIVQGADDTQVVDEVDENTAILRFYSLANLKKGDIILYDGRYRIFKIEQQGQGCGYCYYGGLLHDH